MGGLCGMHRLALRNPPFAMPDHVHFSRASYVTAADLLYDDLMRAYDSWKARRRALGRGSPRRAGSIGHRAGRAGKGGG